MKVYKYANLRVTQILPDDPEIEPLFGEKRNFRTDRVRGWEKVNDPRETHRE